MTLYSFILTTMYNKLIRRRFQILNGTFDTITTFRDYILPNFSTPAELK